MLRIIVIEIVIECRELCGLLQQHSCYDINIYGDIFTDNESLKLICAEKLFLLIKDLIIKNSLC